MLKLAHKGHRTAICMAAQSIPLGSPGMIKREREHAGGWQRRNAQGPWRLRLFPMSSTNYPAGCASFSVRCCANAFGASEIGHSSTYWDVLRGRGYMKRRGKGMCVCMIAVNVSTRSKREYWRE